MVEVFRLLPVCWLLVSPVPAQVRHPLPVLWMMPVGSGSGRDNLTAGVDPAVRLALQDLKRQPPPLGNYEIQFHLLDSQCDPAESLKALFDAMWAGPDYLLLFGGVCPSVTALIARSLPALNLLQVSFSASSPSLSNRKWTGNLFSTVPSDRALNQATLKLLQRFRWTRVGVITQEGPRLSEMKKDLSRQLLKADVQVVSSGSLSEDVCSSLRTLKAYRLNMFGARYQWVVVDGGTAGWRLEGQDSGCTANSLLMAADGSIRLQMRALSNTKTPGTSGRTPQDYQDSYLRQLIQDGSKVSPLHTFAYDAVWVVARALSQVMEAVKHREKYSSQRNLSVSGEEVQRTLLEAVKQTQFEGVTGPVLFRNGERMTSIELIQFQGSSGVLVGDFSTSTQQLRVMNQLLEFAGPGPARDQTVVLVQRQQVGLLLGCTVSSAAAVTIFITLLILFSVIRRQHGRNKDGPQDELLLLGLLLSSSSVLVSGLDGASWPLWTSELLCSVRLWTVSLGSTLSESVLFIRTWRLHPLCSIRQQPASCLLLLLLLLLLLDVLLLSTWQILDPLRRVELQLAPQGLGCLVAWSVRTLDPPEQLTLGVFSVTAFSVVGLVGSLLTAHNPPVQLALTSVLVLGCNLFILSWLFGPKFVHGGEQQQPSAVSEDEDEDEDEERLSRLNQQMKSQTAQLDEEIQNISMQLRDTRELQQLTRGRDTGLRSVTWSHVAQVCSEDRNPEREPLSPDSINSPEHVRRRLSVQLPILHLSYLPAVGGVSASSSSLSGSRDAFVPHDDYFLFQ